MPMILVNPLDESQRPAARPAPRLDSLAGTSIALLDISKRGSSVFLDRLESLLKQDFGVKEIVREVKPTFAKPAPLEVIERLRRTRVQAVIQALAD